MHSPPPSQSPSLSRSTSDNKGVTSSSPGTSGSKAVCGPAGGATARPQHASSGSGRRKSVGLPVTAKTPADTANTSWKVALPPAWTMLSLCAAVIAATIAVVFAQNQTGRPGAGGSGGQTVNGVTIPSNAVFLSPSSFSVIGQSNTSSGSPFRTDLFTPFNPTNTAPPFFQIFDPSFLSLIIPRGAPRNFVPFLRQIARNDSFAFAHEAPVFIRRAGIGGGSGTATSEAQKIAQGTIFFASNDGGALGFSDLNHNNAVFRIELGDIATLAPGQFLEPVHVPLPDSIQMTNGGTPFRHKLLLANSGRGDPTTAPQHASNLALVEPNPPYNATVLVDNFFGRAFNSLNDLKILRDGKGGEFVFFTDAPYGFLNAFRSAPLLPNQVYRLNPATGELRVAVDGFDKCNGIGFGVGGKIAYVTDTGVIEGNLGNDQTQPATIYAFDVDPTTHAFTNRRTFAYVDNGVADGINVDEQGNVYSGCGDGVHVWNPSGTLLGKIFINTTSANLAFVNDEPPSASGSASGGSTLVILAETSVFVARLAVRGIELDL